MTDLFANDDRPYNQHATREEWLNAFITRSRPQFAEIGAPLPEKVRVSLGFTSHGARGSRIGECHASESSADGHFEIFIKPTVENDSRIADILTHELVHAAVGLDAGHGAGFKKVAVALGLKGKMTATVASAQWYAWALPILKELGPMPYGVLGGGQSTAKPKQKTNLLKCECDTCGFIARITRRWISIVEEKNASMHCPDGGCHGFLQVED